MRRLRFVAVVVSFIAAAGIVSACTTTTPTDQGPPSITWTVLDQTTNTSQKVVGTGSVTGTFGHDYTVTDVATSPGGVKTLSLGGAETWSCSSGDLGQNTNADWATQHTSQTPDTSGKVNTELFLLQDFSGDLTCESGFNYSGGGAGLNSTASNFFGKTTTASLKVNIPR